MIALILAAGLLGYGPSAERPKVELIDVVNYASLAAAVGMLAWDAEWSGAHISDWQIQPGLIEVKYYHANSEADPPVIWLWGRNPTREQYLLGAGIGVAAMVGAFAALPQKWKWAPCALVVAGEALNMAINTRLLHVRVPGWSYGLHLTVGMRL